MLFRHRVRNYSITELGYYDFLNGKPRKPPEGTYRPDLYYFGYDSSRDDARRRDWTQINQAWKQHYESMSQNE